MSLEKKVEIHDIAGFVHGALFGLHSIAIYYNLKKGRYIDAAIHTGIAIYDITAAVRHKYTDKEDRN